MKLLRGCCVGGCGRRGVGQVSVLRINGKQANWSLYIGMGYCGILAKQFMEIRIKSLYFYNNYGIINTASINDWI